MALNRGKKSNNRSATRRRETNGLGGRNNGASGWTFGNARASRRRRNIVIAAAMLVCALLLAVVVGGALHVSTGSSTSTSTSTPAPATATQHALNQHLIVCIGDSITEGLADPNNWPYHLQERLGGDWQVVDDGVGGAKTGDMLNRTNEALALNPHFVIILGGTNDLANGLVPLETIQTNIEEMCSRIQSYGAVPVLCTVPPNGYHLEERDLLNAWIAQYAHANGYSLIDFYSVLDNPSNPGTSNPALFNSDGIHPNDAGYVAMANAIDLSIFMGNK